MSAGTWCLKITYGFECLTVVSEVIKLMPSGRWGVLRGYVA